MDAEEKNNTKISSLSFPGEPIPYTGRGVVSNSGDLTGGSCPESRQILQGLGSLRISSINIAHLGVQGPSPHPSLYSCQDCLCHLQSLRPRRLSLVFSKQRNDHMWPPSEKIMLNQHMRTCDYQLTMWLWPTHKTSLSLHFLQAHHPTSLTSYRISHQVAV